MHVSGAAVSQSSEQLGLSFLYSCVAFLAKRPRLQGAEVGEGAAGNTLSNTGTWAIHTQSQPPSCRSTCDWLAAALCNNDVDVGCYHAGKDSQQRRRVQEDWSSVRQKWGDGGRTGRGW
jgi:hypothetical protein